MNPDSDPNQIDPDQINPDVDLDHLFTHHPRAIILAERLQLYMAQGIITDMEVGTPSDGSDFAPLSVVIDRDAFPDDRSFERAQSEILEAVNELYEISGGSGIAWTPRAGEGA